MSNKITYNRTGKRITGQILYTYDEDSDIITKYRVISYKSSQNKYKVYNLNTNEIIWINADELEDSSNYIILNPDGFLTFIIANMNNTNTIKDVLVCLHKRDEINSEMPYAVCRQCIQDIFIENTVLKKSDIEFVGCSISKDTCPSNIPYETVLTFEDMKWMNIAAIYLDDSLESINKYIIPGINIKKYNNVLHTTKQWSKINQPKSNGFSDSVYDLLKDNNFMNDFRKAFGITELTFNIEKDNISNTGYQQFLYKDQLDQFNKIIISTGNEAIMTYILPYSKEIDLSDLNREHLLCKSKDNDDIFIIGYDVKDL